MPTWGYELKFGLNLKIEEVANGYIVFLGDRPEYIAKTEKELKKIVAKVLSDALKDFNP